MTQQVQSGGTQETRNQTLVLEARGGALHQSPAVGTPQMPVSEGQVKRLRLTHASEHHSATCRNDVLTHVTTRRDRDTIVPSEKKPDTQGHALYIIPLKRNVQSRQHCRGREQASGCRGWREGADGSNSPTGAGLLWGRTTLRTRQRRWLCSSGNLLLATEWFPVKQLICWVVNFTSI